MSPATTFGERIRALRKRAGLTQEEAAHQAGISTRGYQGYERGENQPSYVKALAIFAALGEGRENAEGLVHEPEASGANASGEPVRGEPVDGAASAASAPDTVSG